MQPSPRVQMLFKALNLNKQPERTHAILPTRPQSQKKEGSEWTLAEGSAAWEMRSRDWSFSC